MPLTNAQVADTLESVAELLEAQDANPFRVRAYRMAAGTLRGLAQPVAQLYEAEGVDGLSALPTIGESLARSIEQLLLTGRIGLLDQLRGETAPERVLETVPGIGPILAARIHEQLGIESLVELEAAAYDGRLAQVPGFGQDRLRAVRESLAGRFRRRPDLPEGARARPAADEAPLSELLDIDREYLQRATADRLPRIAPRRFNPTGAAWLPVLHTQRGRTHYTALYSNTARAHALGTTKDWVVIYRDDHAGAGQWTVVTSQFGPLKGKRIVRGREAECAKHYAEQPDQAQMVLEASGAAERKP
jgi:putative hydrolase